MADELVITVELDSEEKKQIQTLREQQRAIKKEIQRLKNVDKDGDKIDEWKMLHTLKQEIVERLRKQNVTWKRFVATPDYFEYAWYVSSGTDGAPRRIKTSMMKPSQTETRTDAATMIKYAAEQRSKIVRRKPRKKKTITLPAKPSEKAEAIAKANLS